MITQKKSCVKMSYGRIMKMNKKHEIKANERKKRKQSYSIPPHFLSIYFICVLHISKILFFCCCWCEVCGVECLGEERDHITRLFLVLFVDILVFIQIKIFFFYLLNKQNSFPWNILICPKWANNRN